MKLDAKPVANPMVVLREEFDDWAILFDPETGKGFGLNPVSVFVWKQLDGRHNIADILSKLHKVCTNTPEEAEDHIKKFIESLLKEGLAGYEIQE